MNTISDNILEIMSKEKKLHTAEEQHTAMDKIGGFVYQFYCFLYHVLTMNKGETVSFEKLDDTAVEAGNLITLYQAKHTIQVDAEGEKRALTNRSTDLWKAIDVWRKLIAGKTEEKRSEADMQEYIAKHQFVFFSNKRPDDNKFVSLCEEVKNGADNDRIDAVLDDITQEGRPREGTTLPANNAGRSTQMMIDDLKAFGLKKAFLSRISFETKSQDEVKKACIDHIADKVRFSDEDAPEVFKDFLTEAVDDFFDRADKGSPLSYTYEEQRKRFEHVFQYHRAEKLNFRIIMEEYRKEFLDLICIQQLIKVKDFASSETEEVAKYASHFYSFKNRYDELWEDNKILVDEDKEFWDDAYAFWDNQFKHAYRKLDDSASEDVIIDKAQEILFAVRQHKLKLCKEELSQYISDGAFYYLSDKCIIGWHKSWKEFFKKQGEQDG